MEQLIPQKEYNWTPKTVKNRLMQIIESLENGVQIEISEEEIRSLQQFFNEISTKFLRKAAQGIITIETKKRNRKQ